MDVEWYYISGEALSGDAQKAHTCRSFISGCLVIGFDSHGFAHNRYQL